MRVWFVQDTVEASGDEGLELSDGGALGLALGDLAGDVGLAFGVGAEPHQGSDVQGVVEAAVAAGVELNAFQLAAATLDGRGAAIRGERVGAAEALDVAGFGQHHAANDRPHAVLAQDPGSSCCNEALGCAL